MRRLAAPVLAVLVLAGCSGEEGQRAQQLLDRAQSAQARLTSMSYEMRVSFEAEGQRVSMTMDGGAYLKGRRAGDQVLTMQMEGLPQLGAINMNMVVRRGRLTMNAMGRTFSTEIPASARRQYDWSGTMVDLSRYVKRVKVREGRFVNGEAGSTVSGVIDTAGLLKAVTKLQSFTQATGQATPDMSQAAKHLGDTRAALFIASRSGLIRSAVVTVPVKADGKTLDLELTYRVKTVNRAIPGL